MAAQNRFDEKLLHLRQLRAARLYSPHLAPDFLLRHVGEDLAFRLTTINRRFERVIELFGRTGIIADSLAELANVKEVSRLELAHFHLAENTLPLRTSDLKKLALEPETYDLIVCAFALHWSSDLLDSLRQIKRALRPDGLFLAVLPGTNSLKELKQALVLAETDLFGGISPRIDPFVSLQVAGDLLQSAGFTLPVADTDSIIVRYDTVYNLIGDLRAMGVTSIMRDRDISRFSRQLFERTSQYYTRDHADGDSRIRATFELVSISGWASK